MINLPNRICGRCCTVIINSSFKTITSTTTTYMSNMLTIRITVSITTFSIDRPMSSCTGYRRFLCRINAITIVDFLRNKWMIDENHRIENNWIKYSYPMTSMRLVDLSKLMPKRVLYHSYLNNLMTTRIVHYYDEEFCNRSKTTILIFSRCWKGTDWGLSRKESSLI